MNQLSIFDINTDKLKITKPIRLIEFFAGYGSQALALKYLGANFEHWKTCEWAIKSIQAYKDIHMQEDNTDYSKYLSVEEIKQYLYEKGISQNYNESMSDKQINRIKEETVRQIYNNIQATHNLVNIQQVKGRDLEIIEPEKYTYLLTYSFPCQDLSLAGKGKGMSDTSTRSGMLWEVERIIKECENKPQILLMENVPQVHGKKNIEDFNKWINSLEEMGYTNYWQDLIATDYGIPQTRKRTFMVSILGNYKYEFPKPIELEKKLKDLLEDNVDEKYFLSDKQIESLESGNYNASKPSVKLGITDKGLCQTLDTMSGGNRQPLIRVKNATKQGYLEATEGDGVDISSRMQYHRGNVQKGKSQTITTSGGNDRGVVVNMKTELCNNLIKDGKVKENDVIRHSYTTSRTNDWDSRSVEQNNLSPTLDTRCDCLGVVNNMRIRKLTPKECFRLMGVRDEDYEKVAKNQSNASLYHLAGDSIVVNVLMAIFKEMI